MHGQQPFRQVWAHRGSHRESVVYLGVTWPQGPHSMTAQEDSQIVRPSTSEGEGHLPPSSAGGRGQKEEDKLIRELDCFCIIFKRWPLTQITLNNPTLQLKVIHGYTNRSFCSESTFTAILTTYLLCAFLFNFWHLRFSKSYHIKILITSALSGYYNEVMFDTVVISSLLYV